MKIDSSMRFMFSVLVLAAASSMASAQAPARPEAGSLMQQIEQGKPLRLPKVEAVPVPQPPEMAPQSGLSVTLSGMRFEGNHRLDSARLLELMAHWLGRPLAFTDLQSAAAALAQAYRTEGWVVRAYLPQQTLESGVLTIRVVEAVMGEARIESTAPVRVGERRVRATVLAAQPSGQPMRSKDVDRAVLLLGDIPGISAKGSLAPGASDGETDLVLNLTPQPLLNGDVAIDNTGSRSTGSNRISGGLYLNSPLRLGDQLALNLLRTRGNRYARVNFGLPVGYRGLRVGVSASRLDYRVLGADFATLGLNGGSTITSLNLSYPMLRSQQANAYFGLEASQRRYDNVANSVSISDYRLASLTATASGNLSDTLGGGGSSSASLVLVRGRLDLSGSLNQPADAAGARTEGGYTVLRYGVTRYQVMTTSLSLYASFSGQLANRNLDSSERIYLGGVSGVRAYPASEAGGAEGSLFSLESRLQLPMNVMLTAFYDWGQVKVDEDNRFVGAAVINRLTLQGAGLSLAWVSSPNASFGLTWARRIGANPHPTTTGQDQDGTRDLNRFWLRTALAF
ncbi:MAG: ShlB/FhaC/HecB family hemolysin secretion/activation protein [Ideonella sp.]